MVNFRMIRKIAISLPVIAALAGCGLSRTGIQRQARINPISPAVSVNPGCPLIKGNKYDSRMLAINLDCYTFPEDSPAVDGKVSIRSDLAIVKATKTESDRNRLVAIIMTQSETVCTMTMGQLVADESAVNGTLSFASTATAGAATIVGGELAKSILSGVSAISSATRENYNNNILRSSASRWIYDAIANERKSVATEIRGKFTQSKTVWPIEAAILDINIYHGLCDLKSGLRLVAASVNGKPTAELNESNRTNATKMARIDEEILRINDALKAVGDDAAGKKALNDRLAALAVARSKIGIDEQNVTQKPEVEAPKK